MTEPSTRQRRKLAAILMADVAGFSRLMGRDEERTTARIRDFHQRVKALIEAHEGRLVDTAGDSVFGEFDSVVNAARCACQVQEMQAAQNADQPAGERIDTRIGIHLGDVIVEDYRVWGDGVNIAARLEQLAEPGGICISEAVYQQIHNKLDLRFDDMGMRELKNIEHPLRLYGIAPPGSAAPVATTSRKPARTRPQRVPRAAGADREWLASLLHIPILVMLILSAALLLSPVFLFNTQGALPALGGVLAGVSLGMAWRRSTRQRGILSIPLGIGIAAGALFTDWSPVTNGLFVLAGAIVAGIGVSRNHADRRQPPA